MQNKFTILHGKAEENLAVLPYGADISIKEDTLSILHQLKIYQMELEVQNEELRRSQTALEAERDRYQLLYDSSPVGYLTIGEKDRILEANLTAVALLEMDRPKLSKVRITRFIHPSDQDRFYQYKKHLNGSGKKAICELRMLSKGGKEFTAKLESAPPVNRNGRREFHTSISDITERRRMEVMLQQSRERNEKVFRDISEGIIHIAQNGTVLEVNERFTKMTGISNEYIAGKSAFNLIMEFVKPKDITQMVVRVKDLLMGNPLAPYELEYKGKTLEISSPLHFSLNEGFSAVFRDITSHKKQEDLQSQELSSKTLMLNEIHHRVKNNFNIVSGILGLQSLEIDDTRARKVMSNCQRRIFALGRIHELLYKSGDFSRIRAVDYIEELTGMLKSAYFIHPGIKITCKIPKTLYLDLDRAVPVVLILNELITNAIKYAFGTGARTGKEEIFIHLSIDQGHHVLAVSDNGPGLPEGFAIQNTASLGLQIVNMMVENLKGTISFENGSRAKAGATITIRFPVPA